MSSVKLAGANPVSGEAENHVPSRNSSTSQSVIAFAGSVAGEMKELSAEMRFRWCPAGQYTMGTPGATDSESPVNVVLSRGFWQGETVVTQRLWQSLIGMRPWQDKPKVSHHEDSPATYISYHDAVRYCEALTSVERNAGRLPAGWVCVLPTEAQWEYACRAGTSTKFSFGDSESRLDEFGWYARRSWLDRFGRILNAGRTSSGKYAHRVGLKKPNDWGIRDMHGNVWEWCSDWYCDTLPGGCDPVGPQSGERRVNRGGSWSGLAEYCRAADRGSCSPDGSTSDLGFRIAIVESTAL